MSVGRGVIWVNTGCECGEGCNGSALGVNVGVGGVGGVMGQHWVSAGRGVIWVNTECECGEWCNMGEHRL